MNHNFCVKKLTHFILETKSQILSFSTLRPTQWSVMIIEFLIAAALSITLFLIHNGFFCFPCRWLMPLQLAESNQAPPHPKQMGYQMRRLRDSSKPLEWTSAHAHTHTNTWLLPGNRRQQHTLLRFTDTHLNTSMPNTNAYMHTDANKWTD